MGIDVQPQGPRLFDPFPVTDAVANMRGVNDNPSLTALAGGGQIGATQLLPGMNEVTVSATNGDSVQLPPAIAGQMVLLVNADAAQNIQVFGKEGRTDTINGTAGATGVTQNAGISALYWCPRDGIWYRLLSA